MSSLKNRPANPPKSRNYDTVSNPLKILSMAIRYGIANHFEIIDYQWAIENRDSEKLMLYHEFLIPYYRDYLKTLFVDKVS